MDIAREVVYSDTMYQLLANVVNKLTTNILQNAFKPRHLPSSLFLRW